MKKKLQFERLVFLLSAAFFVFLCGFLTYHFELFPSYYLKRALEEAKAITGNFKPHHLNNAVYDREGAHSLDPSAVQPGLNLLTSHWPDFGWRSGLKLIDEAGRALHQWRADPEEPFPNETGLVNKYVHGSYLFPNGDVLFSIEYGGLVMMDACGQVKWQSEYKTRRCVTRNQDGNFWVCGQVTWSLDRFEDQDYIRQFPGLKLPLYEDAVLEVSSDGRILRDIKLVKVIYDNNLVHYLVKNSRSRNKDIFHLNDVEALPAEMAAQYPMFDTGDLVVSIRNMNIVLVPDPGTGKVKWYATDPFLAQHDPDFPAGGWITLFDNNADFTERGTMLGGSRILASRSNVCTVRNPQLFAAVVLQTKKHPIVKAASGAAAPSHELIRTQA